MSSPTLNPKWKRGWNKIKIINCSEKKYAQIDRYRNAFSTNYKAIHVQWSIKF